MNVRSTWLLFACVTTNEPFDTVPMYFHLPHAQTAICGCLEQGDELAIARRIQAVV